jgi:hypothetical protein
MIRRKAVLAGWVLLWNVEWSRAAEPRPIAELSLDTLVTTQVRDASPAFLSDDSISLLIRSRASGTNGSVLAVLRLAENKLQTVSSVSRSDGATNILAASGQRMLVWSQRNTTLYSSDLRRQWTVPMRKRLLARSFSRSGVIGEWDGNGWDVVRLSPGMSDVRGGTGQLLSLSDDVMVVRRDDIVRVETPDGRLLGSIAVPADTRGAPIAEVAGPGRLFLDLGNASRIVDFGGRSISIISRPQGWGFRRGWSSDGSRVLFDHYTRRASLLERVIDSIGSVLIPVPEESTGETVTVVDTSTGQVCFRLGDSSLAFGTAGQMHADISPSGRLVGIATLTKFALYSLPETCSGT